MKTSLSFSFVSLLLALLVAGCASSPKYAPVASIPPDRAIVYFYCGKDVPTVPCQIVYNNKRITTIVPGKYFAHQPKAGVQAYSVPPAGKVGLVGFMLDQPGVETTRIRLQPGKVYYVKALGLGTLLRVDNVTGSQEIAECELAKPDKVATEELPAPPLPPK